MSLTQYHMFQPGLRTWLSATCDGYSSYLEKLVGLWLLLAPTIYANYWIEELDKLLTNKATGGFLVIFRMIYEY
jgi:hypothetical protein